VIIRVLMAVTVKMAVFWAVAPCNLVEVYRRCRGACCLLHQGMFYDTNFLFVHAFISVRLEYPAPVGMNSLTLVNILRT
jgi:hypothetical protein